MKYLNAKKNYYYEKDIYTCNYSNDIIYKSNKTWNNSKVEDSDENSFPIKLKEIANRRSTLNEIIPKEYLINDNYPKEYGNKIVNSVKSNKIYEFFEKDFELFIKNQYNI